MNDEECEIFERFRGLRPAQLDGWTEESKVLFVKFVRLVHAAGWDWYFTDEAPFVARFGRKLRGGKRAPLRSLLGKVTGARDLTVTCYNGFGGNDFSNDIGYRLTEDVIGKVVAHLKRAAQRGSPFYGLSSDQPGEWPIVFLKKQH